LKGLGLGLDLVTAGLDYNTGLVTLTNVLIRLYISISDQSVEPAYVAAQQLYQLRYLH